MTHSNGSHALRQPTLSAPIDSGSDAPISAPKAREGFLDAVRAIATIRVVLWHAFGAPALSFVVASMPTMFFVAGSLLASSLDRRSFRQVLRDRVRRLLIPFWLFGAFTWTVLAISRARVGGQATAISPTQLFSWFLPLVDPKGSAWEGGWLSQPLWYLRAFLWLLLVAPLLRGALRYYGKRVFLVPVVVVFVMDQLVRRQFTGLGFQTWRWYVGDFALYSIFLMIGFMHRDGTFKKMRQHVRVEWLIIAASAAAVWCVTQPLIGNVVNNSYPAHLLVGMAWLLLFLCAESLLAKTTELPRIGTIISWLTSRSLTVYLWHTTAIVSADFILDRIAPTASRLFVIPLIAIIIPLFAAIVGWAEDMAASRPPRLWPVPTRWSRSSGELERTPNKSTKRRPLSHQPIFAAIGGFGAAMALVAAVSAPTTGPLSAASQRSDAGGTSSATS